MINARTLLVASCLPVIAFSASVQADLFADVDAANQAFAKALMAKDIDQVVGFYTEDACVLAPGAGRLVP